MALEVQKCPECSAPLAPAAHGVCTYCGARFVPVQEPRAASPPEETVRDRLARLALREDVRAALAGAAPIGSHRRPPIAQFVFGIAVIFILIVMSKSFASLNGAFALFPIGMAVVVGIGLVRSLASEQSIAAKERVRRIAFVVAKRSHVSGGEPTSTAYFVTLEFDDGTRQEFDVDGKQFGLCAEDDIGVAETQGPRLHGFLRFDAAD